MLKKAEESSVFTSCWRIYLCACALDVCAGNFSHSARLFRQQSRASYMLALCVRAVLILSPGTWDWTRMHALVVIHRRTLCENVDSAKIKVPFIQQISIFYAWHRCIVSSYIVSIYRWIVTPLVGPYPQRFRSLKKCFANPSSLFIQNKLWN